MMAIIKANKNIIQDMNKRDLTQLNIIEQYLKEKNIPYERIDKENKPLSSETPYMLIEVEQHQICVPCFDASKRQWDVVCHRGSYGADDGLLEIYGTIVPDNAGDTVEGFLTVKGSTESPVLRFFHPAEIGLTLSIANLCVIPPQGIS